MVDLATAKAENITGRSKPMIVDPMATGDTKGATIPRESPPGSPLTPVPGPSPELPVHPFAFDTRSTLTSSLSAPSAINNIQIASPPSSASPTKSMAIETATTMTDGGEPAQKKTLATKGKCMMFEQGHPVEMNTFAQPETRARTPVTVDVHSSLPPLPPTLGGLTTSWTDAHTVEAHKDGSPATNARRTRIATCSGPIGGGMARSGRTVPLAGSTNISQSLPTSSSMSSLGLETNDAQFNLALCYEHGQGGVDQDLGKAIHFYQQAAAQGHSKASYNLGCICFHRGLVHRAIGWFELASKCRVRDLEAIRRAEQDMDDDRGQPSSQQSMTDDVDMCPPWKTNYLAALSGHVLAAGTDPLAAETASSFSGPLSSSLPSSLPAAAAHDLLEQLHGPSVIVEQATVATFGPTAPYLPAMLTLALLCRQGVPSTTTTTTTTTTKTTGEAKATEKSLRKETHAKRASRGNSPVFLQRDHQQAIRVLQKLIAMAPPTMANEVEGSLLSSSDRPLAPPCHAFFATEATARANDGGSKGPVAGEPSVLQTHEQYVSPALRTKSCSSSSGGSSSSSHSTSCPNLLAPSSGTFPSFVRKDYRIPSSSSSPSVDGMANSSEDGEKDQSILSLQPMPQSNQRPYLAPTRRRSRHHQTLPPRHPFATGDAMKERQVQPPPPRLPPMPPSIDDHEAWSVCLARYLLQYWQQQDASASSPSPSSSSTAPAAAAAAASRERIQRYHLLHMTNPTNGKTLYNLGLIYDVYLNVPVVASRCYLSAYERSVVAAAGVMTSDEPGGSPSSSGCTSSSSSPSSPSSPSSSSSSSSSSSTCPKNNIVTRINSAWNLGVLYAKDQQWAVGREWFLRAQQELLTTKASPSSPCDPPEMSNTTHHHHHHHITHAYQGAKNGEALLLVAKNQHQQHQQHQQPSKHTSHHPHHHSHPQLCTDAERVEAVLALMDRELIRAGAATL
ncbi:hypothetical protein DFQ27_006679 [Actinomortierella ambigua]|uniref:HCP-like protein n=1 Tax=Actinomortierella ambigua TaxID=1343610 RepID=A0A9P6QH31_9FUNG|nr:hypothetical protein DFQ27_006679 [Actinomortierella ambigua]